MYRYLLFILIVVESWCYPQKPKEEILQLQYSPLRDVENGIQTYSYSFSTSNGISRDETGVHNPDPAIGMSVKGSYSYTRPDGKIERVNYIADTEGFRIVPAVPPPAVAIPPAALASLAG